MSPFEFKVKRIPQDNQFPRDWAGPTRHAETVAGGGAYREGREAARNDITLAGG